MSNNNKETDKCTLCGVIATINNISTKETTGTTIWSGGWITDNFETYYLDDNNERFWNI